MGHRDRHSLVKLPPPDCLIEELDSRPKVASRNSCLLSDSSCSGTEQQSKRPRSSPKVDAKAPSTAESPKVDAKAPLTADSPKVDAKAPLALKEAVDREKICLEICAGSGKLTVTFKKAGKQCIGIDNLRNKAATGKGFLTLDLTLPASQKIVLDKIAQGRVAFVWFAPPCGTASRARERPLPKSVTSQGVTTPKPLRTESEPLGIQGLTGLDALRVQQANLLYDFVASAATACSEAGVMWVIENPARSLMWHIPSMTMLLQIPLVQDVFYHGCMHGGKRDKHQRLRCSGPQFAEMALLCDGKHEHLPWSYNRDTGFSTAGEAEYPQLFCDRVVSVVLKHVQVSASNINIPTPAEMTKAITKMAAGKQPRGKLCPILIPDYHSVRTVYDDSDHEWLKLMKIKWLKTDQLVSGNMIPAGSRIMSCTRIDRGVTGNELHKFEIKIGLTMQPKAWVDQALQLQHPMQSAQALQEWQERAIFNNLTRSKAATIQHRAEVVSKYVQLANELEKKELLLHQAMHPDIRGVNQGKRLYLLGRMMADAGFPQHECNDLVAQFAGGFPLTGDVRSSGLFNPEDKPAPNELKDVWKIAKHLQDTAISNCRSSGSVRIDTDVMEGTKQECLAKVAAGPFTREQIEQKHGKCWLPSRRFGILQGDSVRIIDDMSEFLPNSTVSVHEKLTLGGIDEVVVMAKEYALRSLLQSVARPGSATQVPVHSDWKQRPMHLQGKCLDLKAAYKQMARRMSDAHAAIAVVFDPGTGGPQFYEIIGMPFGSVASVHSFNRVARILAIIIASLLDVVVSNYFDDFPMAEDIDLSNSARVAVEALLKLLGWRISNNPKKSLAFGDQFQVLGVLVDFMELVLGKIQVSNTEKRLIEMEATLRDIIQEDVLIPSVASHVAGRFGFVYSQFMGKALVAPMFHLRQRASQLSGPTRLHPPLLFALLELLYAVKNTPPRVISFLNTERPTVVFTDGAVERGGDLVTCGAVLFSPRLSAPSFFGIEVPFQVRRGWMLHGTTHVVAQAELLPLVLARETWKHLLGNAWVLYFIDNESVKAALVKGNTAAVASFELLSCAARQDMEAKSMSWYARVPSPSNCADGPSRLDFTEMRTVFDAGQVVPKWPRCLLENA
jgi:hypothetical protein